MALFVIILVIIIMVRLAGAVRSVRTCGNELATATGRAVSLVYVPGRRGLWFRSNNGEEQSCPPDRNAWEINLHIESSI